MALLDSGKEASLFILIFFFSCSPRNLMRAARHYESATHILIRNAVLTAAQFVRVIAADLPPVGRWVTAESPVRIDLAGGWSDTPPITLVLFSPFFSRRVAEQGSCLSVSYEHGGVVLNVAIRIDNKKPVGAKVRRLETPEIVLVLSGQDERETRIVCSDLDDLRSYNQPLSPGALLKAALVVAEIVDLQSPLSLAEQLGQRYQSGFELKTWSHLPQGSGLGTSSILAGALLAALGVASGQRYDTPALLHAVLYLEQVLTTGGGWQDQAGGLLPGFKLTTSGRGLPLRVEARELRISGELCQSLEAHLFLFYTGKTRLARDLLQSVLRWDVLFASWRFVFLSRGRLTS